MRILKENLRVRMRASGFNTINEGQLCCFCFLFLAQFVFYSTKHKWFLLFKSGRCWPIRALPMSIRLLSVLYIGVLFKGFLLCVVLFCFVLFWCKCTFSFYILYFFHFDSYILFLPLLIPKPINA